MSRQTHSYAVGLVFGLAALYGLQYFNHSLALGVVYGICIVVGALLIAWAGESSEFIISEGLALAIVAWVQVFPEFMIEATIAWAGDVPNMFANFTGANRILTGVGWPLVFFTASFFNWKKRGKWLYEIRLHDVHSAEVVFFLAATIYILFAYARGSLELVDSAVLLGLYLTYLYVVSRFPSEGRQKEQRLVQGVPRLVMNLTHVSAVYVIAGMFLVGGALIFLVAEPFYQTMLVLAGTYGISQFLFIQWIAPFLSEFPEKTSAFYWASSIRHAPMALMNLISSKLTQWTVLLAIIPIVYSASNGYVAAIPLNEFTRKELLLTIATSFYAVTLLLKLRFQAWEAVSLFALWLLQFVFVEWRTPVTIAYLLLTAYELARFRHETANAFLAFHNLARRHLLR